MATSDFRQFSPKLQRIPWPVCICFYNGTEDQPERKLLSMSDAYDGKGDIEVKVTMLNINYGKNMDLMESCRPLREYARIVDSVRQKRKDGKDLDTAVDEAIEEMPDGSEIKPFLIVKQSGGKEHVSYGV